MSTADNETGRYTTDSVICSSIFYRLCRVSGVLSVLTSSLSPSSSSTSTSPSPSAVGRFFFFFFFYYFGLSQAWTIYQQQLDNDNRFSVVSVSLAVSFCVVNVVASKIDRQPFVFDGGDHISKNEINTIIKFANGNKTWPMAKWRFRRMFINSPTANLRWHLTIDFLLWLDSHHAPIAICTSTFYNRNQASCSESIFIFSVFSWCCVR